MSLYFLRQTVIQWNRSKKKKRFIVACKEINRKKLLDPHIGEEHYQLFIRNKNTKSVEQSETITYQPRTFENPNIVDTKLIITEHLKTLHNNSDTKKVKLF